MLKFTGFVNFNVLLPFALMFILKSSPEFRKLLDGLTRK